MAIMRKIFLLIIVVGLFLTSCSQATLQSTATGTLTGVLTPYQTTTPPPITPSPTLKITIPVTPTSTATPFIYILNGDETMLGLAYQFGVSLEALQAANPDVDPHYMGAGLKLIIPINNEVPETLVTPTPVPLQSKSPKCYPSGDGGLWCIIAMINNSSISVENLSVWIGLYDSRGKVISSQVAYSPLDILHPSATMPLMAYFTSPAPTDYQVRAELINALAVSADDARYLDVQSSITTMIISPDGTQADISGEVILPAGTPAPSQIWVLVVAYDESGNILGARKWKSGGETNFKITVYSLAGRIDHAGVLVEARP